MVIMISNPARSVSSERDGIISSNCPMRICKTITDADDPVAQTRNACSGRPLPLAHRLAAVGSRVGSEPLAGRARPAARASSSRARGGGGGGGHQQRGEQGEGGRPPVAEEEAATAVAGKRRWRPARAPRRPHCPGSALPAAGERKKRSPAARSGRRGKEEKEEPRRQIRSPGKRRGGGGRRPPSGGRLTFLLHRPLLPRGRGRRGLECRRRPAARRAPRAVAAAAEESGSGVGVEPWRRAGAGGGDRRAGAGGGERREEGGGVREAVGMQTPRGCARGGTCCILQQLLQFLLELLQFPSVLQNEDADWAAAIAGDSLIRLRCKIILETRHDDTCLSTAYLLGASASRISGLCRMK